MTSDIEKLKEETVVFVGTVGRIRELGEHMDQNWLKKVEYLFIDEADALLNPDFYIDHLFLNQQYYFRSDKL